jgi:hypothetical protein
MPGAMQARIPISITHRHRDADGIPYLVFSICLFFYGLSLYVQARLHPLSTGVSSVVVDYRRLLGGPWDWAVSALQLICFLIFVKRRSLIRWIRKKISGSGASLSDPAPNKHQMEFGHILMMAPVFVFIVGLPYANTPADRYYWMLAFIVSLLVSFTGVLRVRRAPVSDYVYLVLPALAFPLWRWLNHTQQLLKNEPVALLFFVQAAAFIAIGLIHLVIYFRSTRTYHYGYPKPAAGTLPTA